MNDLSFEIFSTRRHRCKKNIKEECSVFKKKLSIGGILGGKIVNHIIYANNLCIVSLSSSGLQTGLNICTDYCHLN